MSNEAILTLNQLVIGYGDPLSEPISLEVKPGERLALKVDRHSR